MTIAVFVLIIIIFSLILLAYSLVPIFFSIFVNGPPFVPTPMKTVRRMLELADIRKGDVIYDLGCGDGRLVIEAERKYGARGIGVEASFFVWARAMIRRLRLRSKAEIRKEDMFDADISDADAVVCYLFSDIMDRLKDKFIKELRPEAKIISHGFAIKDWKPVHEEGKKHRILVYEMGKSDK